LIRVAFDSNILIYLAGVARAQSDDEKIYFLREIQAPLEQNATLVFPVQSLGELAVALRRSGRSRSEVRDRIAETSGDAVLAPTTRQTFESALTLADDHQLQVWDSIILSAAIETGCTILLSEDMQHGFTIHGLTIINPLIEPVHPKLAALL
jgi:predicted nucleic acid-binding protein